MSRKSKSSPSPPKNLRAKVNYITVWIFIFRYPFFRRIQLATATLTWTLPTTRVDGSPLAVTDIASVHIFDGGVEIDHVGAVTSFTTDVLTVGQHDFTVTVTDTTGHTSAASNVSSVTVVAVLANPSPVSDLTAVLNP